MMNQLLKLFMQILKLKNYKEQLQDWPQQGYHIMAQYDEEKIIVYQSYRKEIGEFAVKNQYFGGAFSLERMTWIKPNFLWMMYRNGWGTKEDQEYVLAIHLKMEAFKNTLGVPYILHTTADWEFPGKNGRIRYRNFL